MDPSNPSQEKDNEISTTNTNDLSRNSNHLRRGFKPLMSSYLNGSISTKALLGLETIPQPRKQNIDAIEKYDRKSSVDLQEPLPRNEWPSRMYSTRLTLPASVLPMPIPILKPTKRPKRARRTPSQPPSDSWGSIWATKLRRDSRASPVATTATDSALAKERALSADGDVSDLNLDLEEGLAAARTRKGYGTIMSARHEAVESSRWEVKVAMIAFVIVVLVVVLLACMVVFENGAIERDGWVLMVGGMA